MSEERERGQFLALLAAAPAAGLAAIAGGIGIAFLAAAPALAAAGDAMAALDEFNIRSSIIYRCHPNQDAADQAFLARGDALRRAAIAQLRAQLDRANPARSAENEKRAEETVAQRTAERDYDISEQVRNYGCDWLDGRFIPSGPGR